MVAEPKPPRNGYRHQVLAYQRVSREEAQTGGFTFQTQSARIRERMDSLYGPGNYDLEVLKDDGLSGAFGPEPTAVERRTRPTLKVVAAKLASGSR